VLSAHGMVAHNRPFDRMVTPLFAATHVLFLPAAFCKRAVFVVASTLHIAFSTDILLDSVYLLCMYL